MIPSVEHLAVFEDMRRELESHVRLFNSTANGLTDKIKLLQLKREQLLVLKEMMRRHERALQFMEGKTVEPEVHFAESVLMGVGGGAG